MNGKVQSSQISTDLSDLTVTHKEGDTLLVLQIINNNYNDDFVCKRYRCASTVGVTLSLFLMLKYMDEVMHSKEIKIYPQSKYIPSITPAFPCTIVTTIFIFHIQSHNAICLEGAHQPPYLSCWLWWWETYRREDWSSREVCTSDVQVGPYWLCRHGALHHVCQSMQSRGHATDEQCFAVSHYASALPNQDLEASSPPRSRCANTREDGIEVAGGEATTHPNDTNWNS